MHPDHFLFTDDCLEPVETYSPLKNFICQRGIFLVDRLKKPSRFEYEAADIAKLCHLGPPALARRNESTDPLNTRGPASVSHLPVINRDSGRPRLTT
jgi:hypothetical protein